jgi:hypothetical protein
MKQQGVQVSKPIVITRKTPGGHQGKVFVLYTKNPKQDLSNKTSLSRILKNLSLNKVTSETKEGFDIVKFTRDGVGVIMLDAKPITWEGLLAKYKNKLLSNLNRSSSPVKSVSNRRMVGFIKELADVFLEIEAPEGELSLNYTKLKKIGKDDTGAVIKDTVVMTPESKAELKIMLQGMKDSGSPAYDALMKQILATTHDSSLGYYKVAALNSPLEIQRFFTLDGQERQDFYNENIANNPDLVEELENYGIVGGEIFHGASSENHRGAFVSGRLWLNNSTKSPIVLSDNNPLTFIPPGTNGYSGQEAIFSPLRFLKMATTKFDEGTTVEMISLLDSIMKNYTMPGTLRKGLLWNGQLTNALDDSLSMSLLDESYSDDMLMTSVKSIGEPVVMMDVNYLTSLGVPRTSTQSTAPADTKSTDERRAKIDEEARSRFAEFLLSLENVTTIEQYDEQAKIALRDIRAILSKNKLFSTEEITTIMNELEKGIGSARVEIMKDLNSKPKDISKEIEDNMKKAGAEYTASAVNEMIDDLEQMTDDELKVPRKAYIRSIRMVMNKAALTPEETLAINQRISDLETKYSNEPVVDLSVPSIAMTAIITDVGATSEYLPNVVELIDRLGKDDSKLTAEQRSSFKDLHTLFTNPSSLDSDPAARARAIKLLNQLSVIARVVYKFKADQVDDLLEELSSLQAFNLKDQNSRCIF